MNGIVYTRVSTDKGSQETSLKRQKEELLKAAEREKITVVKTVEEQASGYDAEREGLLAALEAFREAKAEVLLVQDDTRLGRGHAKIALIHQLKKMNVAVYSLRDDGEPQLSETDTTRIVI